jgi:SNF2 family DNA or RNA helicase
MTIAIADSKAERKARLEAVFHRRAEGKAWVEGVYPHQWSGACYGAVAKRWILADEVGVGKTRTIIGWLDLVQARKVILMAEANICSQFAGEVEELAPHRTVISLNGLTPVTRRARLSELAFKTDAVVVVNFELFRSDEGKIALGQLARWGADTFIVDEAHNLKATATGNFKNAQTLTFYDNTCPRCSGKLDGLYDANIWIESGHRRKVPTPCLSCGWKKGDETGVEYPTHLAEALATKSVQNLALLTGTPILNNPGDLYASIHLMDPVTWPTFQAYQKRYLVQNFASGRWEWREGALNMLRTELKGRFLQRTKADVGINLPTQHIHHVHVDLDPERYPLQYRTIRQITERAMIELSTGEQANIMAIIAVITRKRQANVWPAGIEIRDQDGEVIFSVGKEVRESAKLDVIGENVVDLWQQGSRQIVFSQFTTALEEFERRLSAKGLRVARLDGSTPKRQRELIKADFDLRKLDGRKGRYDVLLAQYRSGGTGLNFTAAQHIHTIDEEWSPGKKTQAFGRNHRIGQTSETHVWIYRLRNTIDQWLANLIQGKKEMITEFEEGVVRVGKNELKASLLEGMKNGEIL